MIPKHRKYYAEIDGLRAVAVLSVVLFHLDLSFISGGFVGVDVFFVISGFLITRNIYSDIKQEKFQLLTFYYRRFMRLFPAFLVTIIICFIFAFLLFSPAHFKRLSESTLYALTSLSNFYFWNESGYFNSSSIFKPLLHFWSLSAEEQFYLFWPPFLILLYRKWQKVGLVVGLVTLCIISVSITEVVVRQSSETAFYLMPFRIYEFAIGALCVWLISSKHNNFIKELGLITGLLLVLWSVFYFSRETLFPGFSALIPSLGAALIIISTGSQYSGLILKNRIAIHIGLISYSLYLVHWPVIIFYQYWKGAELTGIEKLLLLTFSLFLAELMYFFVERRFKLKKETTLLKKPVWHVAPFLIITILIALPSVHSMKHYGWWWRIDVLPKQTKFICQNETKHEKLERKCVIGANGTQIANVLLLGDSHAGHLLPGLDQLGKKANLKIDVWTHPGCPPIWGTYKIFGTKAPKRQQTCKSLIPKWEKVMASGRYKTIILANRWMWLFEPVKYGKKNMRRDYLADRDKPEMNSQSARILFKDRLQLNAKKIHKAGSRLIIFSQIPLLGWNIQDCNHVPQFIISPNPNIPRCDGGISYKAAMKRLAYTNKTIRDLGSKKTMVVIPSDYICDHKVKKCRTVIGKQVIYRDRNHLNNTGSLFLVHKIEDAFLNFIGNNENLGYIKHSGKKEK